ncbi:peptidoglycan DD-metalloendopeptidase family protein [Lysobacter sp. 2RAF19]
MNPSILRVGIAAACALALSACGSSTVYRTKAPASPAPRVSTPKPGKTVVVNKGDTMYGIAFRNGIDVRDLAAWNGIGAPYTIYPGQHLRLFPKGSTSVATTTPSRPTSPQTTSPKPVTQPAPRPVPPPAPVASPIAWTWPANGTILNSYVAGEPTKQGIDIAGNAGDPVRAAGDGVVVYSGAGLVGYGELIIVKHNDAWLSAYGHNRKRLVNEGQLVKAGQQIAEMGRTGAAREMVHFEIRYNGKPVDPQTYLPKR